MHVMITEISCSICVWLHVCYHARYYTSHLYVEIWSSIEYIPCTCLASGYIQMLLMTFTHTWSQLYIWAESTCAHCGDGQWAVNQKTTCDGCRLIWSVPILVFAEFNRIYCVYESLRCLRFEIWHFFVDDDRMDYYTHVGLKRGSS